MENKDSEKILKWLEYEPYLEEDDIEPIIKELQRIIHDDSVNKKGFQAKFARMISELQEKRMKARQMDEVKWELRNKDPSEVNDWLLDNLKEEIQKSSGKDKFEKLLKIAQIRETLNNPHKTNGDEDQNSQERANKDELVINLDESPDKKDSSVSKKENYVAEKSKDPKEKHILSHKEKDKEKKTDKNEKISDNGQKSKKERY